MFWPSGLVQALDRGIRVTLPLAIASGVLLSPPVSTSLHIDQMNELVVTLVFVFIATSISLIIGLLARLCRRDKAKAQKSDLLRQRLMKLSADEKATLKEHLVKDKKSMIHSLGEGAAFGLVRKGIMYQPSPFGRPGGVSLNVTDEAWDYLQENPSLLE